MKIWKTIIQKEKRRVLIVFNYMIANMVTELFLRGKSFRLFLYHNLTSKCLILYD